jgi:hypothetical protein
MSKVRKSRNGKDGNKRPSAPLPGSFGLKHFLWVAGLACAGGSFLTWAVIPPSNIKSTVQAHSSAGRSVWELLALPDAELEKVDVLEMNLAVAKGIPGLEKLDYSHYRQIVDDWTEQFRRELAATEPRFYQSPGEWRNDINFFRLGLLCTYLTRERGIGYIEKYSQDQKQGRNSKYQSPEALLLHGLIDTQHGTCANMPVLHVVIGRRMGWPVSLACVGPHYVCRYDDGKVHYNIEATYTGPGFVSDSDEEYMQHDHLPKIALASGSDFRSLSAREMMGCFLCARA